MCRIEDKYEQVCNLLASWKILLALEEQALKAHGRTRFLVAGYNRFKRCIDELESVLSGKPLE